MKLSVQIFISLISLNGIASLALPNLNNKGVVDPPNNRIMDSRVNYEIFSGRVTDKDSTGKIIKVKFENNNIKFLKSGDFLEFSVNNHKRELSCRAHVKKVEKFYAVLFVRQFKFCWPKDKYFLRGTILNFKSRVLAQRIFEATKYREILLLKKDGFLSQLSRINNYLLNYDQERIRVAARYDERINELEREKRIAVDSLLRVKEEKILLQSKLQAGLDKADVALDFYRIERQENLFDRWDMDQDTNIPVGQRPLKIKSK